AQRIRRNCRRVSSARMLSSNTLLRLASTADTTLVTAGTSRMTCLIHGHMMTAVRIISTKYAGCTKTKVTAVTGIKTKVTINRSPVWLMVETVVSISLDKR